MEFALITTADSADKTHCIRLNWWYALCLHFSTAAHSAKCQGSKHWNLTVGKVSWLICLKTLDSAPCHVLASHEGTPAQFTLKLAMLSWNTNPNDSNHKAATSSDWLLICLQESNNDLALLASLWNKTLSSPLPSQAHVSLHTCKVMHEQHLQVTSDWHTTRLAAKLDTSTGPQQLKILPLTAQTNLPPQTIRSNPALGSQPLQTEAPKSAKPVQRDCNNNISAQLIWTTYR